MRVKLVAYRQAQDKMGQTSLLWAVQNRNEAVVGLLLEKGAKAEAMY